MTTRIAAVDIGSNSVLMCVGEPLPGGDFRIIYDSARTTRLAEGMSRRRMLTRSAIRRTNDALRDCRKKAQILGVGLAKAVATAAVREADNAEAFLTPAKNALGFGVEVISGEREAELTFLGVAGGSMKDPAVIIDVGGASTEIALVKDGRVERVESLPVGAARLKESIPSEDVLRFFVKVIEVIPTDLDPAMLDGRRAILVGGTATTLAAMRLGLRRYDADRIEGMTVKRFELSDQVERVRAMPLEERHQVVGLPASRADIIASGGLVMVQVLEDLGIEEASVSTRGLRHGLLTEIARGKL